MPCHDLVKALRQASLSLLGKRTSLGNQKGNLGEPAVSCKETDFCSPLLATWLAEENASVHPALPQLSHLLRNTVNDCSRSDADCICLSGAGVGVILFNMENDARRIEYNREHIIPACAIKARLDEVSGRSPRTSFSNVERNRHRTPHHLPRTI